MSWWVVGIIVVVVVLAGLMILGALVGDEEEEEFETTKSTAIERSRLQVAANDQHLLGLSQSQNFEPVGDHLRRISGGDWTECDLAIRILGMMTPVETVDRWAALHPDDGLARLLRGIRYAHWAWEARGNGDAHTVEDEGWNLFGERLNAAQEDLNLAHQMLPTNPSAAALLLAVCRGLSWSLQDRQHLFKEVRRRDPLHVTGHLQAIQAFTPKWGGDMKLVFNIARKAGSRAPEGHPLCALVICAHYEAHIQRQRDGTHDGSIYLGREDVLQECQGAFDRAFACHRTPPVGSALMMLQQVAPYFHTVGDEARLHHAMKLIANRPPEHWGYYSDSNGAWIEAMEISKEYAQSRAAA